MLTAWRAQLNGRGAPPGFQGPCGSVEAAQQCAVVQGVGAAFRVVERFDLLPVRGPFFFGEDFLGQFDGPVRVTQFRVLWSSARGARVPQKILNPRNAFYAIYQGLDGICIGGLRAVLAIEAEVGAPVNRPSITQATGGSVAAHPAASGCASYQRISRLSCD